MKPTENLLAVEAQLIERRRKMAEKFDLARWREFADLNAAIEAVQRARADEEARGAN